MNKFIKKKKKRKEKKKKKKKKKSDIHIKDEFKLHVTP